MSPGFLISLAHWHSQELRFFPSSPLSPSTVCLSLSGFLVPLKLPEFQALTLKTRNKRKVLFYEHISQWRNNFKMPKADFLYAYRPKMNNASFFDWLVGWNHHSWALYTHTHTHTQTYMYMFWDIHIPFEFTILFLGIYPNTIIKYVKRGMHVDASHDTSILVYNFKLSDPIIKKSVEEVNFLCFHQWNVPKSLEKTMKNYTH